MSCNNCGFDIEIMDRKIKSAIKLNTEQSIEIINNAIARIKSTIPSKRKDELDYFNIWQFTQEEIDNNSIGLLKELKKEMMELK